MRRQTINLIVDVLALLAAGALTGTGLILAYRLPPGRANRDLSLLGWGRHDWGDVHLILAWVVIGLVVLHLLLHLGWLANACAALVGRAGAGARRWLWPGLLILLAALLVALPWLLPVQRADEDGRPQAPAAGDGHDWRGGH